MDKRYIWCVLKILNYIEQHFSENIGIKDISHAVQYSPRHCNRLFKMCYGETVSACLRNARLESSKNLLKELKSVKAVSERLFFENSGNFSRAFRARFGISPLKYIKGGEPKAKIQLPTVYGNMRITFLLQKSIA